MAFPLRRSRCGVDVKRLLFPALRPSEGSASRPRRAEACPGDGGIALVNKAALIDPRADGPLQVAVDLGRRQSRLAKQRRLFDQMASLDHLYVPIHYLLIRCSMDRLFQIILFIAIVH